MLKHIATLNEENICSYVVTGNYPDDIALKENQLFVTSPDVLGMKYENGKWVEVEPVAPEPTQLDRIEEQVNTIASGTTSENTEAINALFGV